MLVIEASEVAEGDWSPTEGTVKTVVESGDRITIEFVSGAKITLDRDSEIEIQQGGR